MSYCTIVSAHPRKGWVLAQRFGAVIQWTPLEATDPAAGREEARRRGLVDPSVDVICPDLGEELP